MDSYSTDDSSKNDALIPSPKIPNHFSVYKLIYQIPIVGVTCADYAAEDEKWQ